jgi:hypothetical protein
MKRRVRTQPTNPFYSNEPAVSRKEIADQSLAQNASLGNATPKEVDKRPGRLSGIAGFHDTKRPKDHKMTPVSGKPPGKAPHTPTFRLSGHPGAHQLGKLKSLKKF